MDAEEMEKAKRRRRRATRLMIGMAGTNLTVLAGYGEVGLVGIGVAVLLTVALSYGPLPRLLRGASHRR